MDFHEILHFKTVQKSVKKIQVHENLTGIIITLHEDLCTYVSILINMHSPPVEGSFCNKQGKSLKPATLQGYNIHTGHVDKLHDELPFG
jgi:hypothetical protein